MRNALVIMTLGCFVGSARADEPAPPQAAAPVSPPQATASSNAIASNDSTPPLEPSRIVGEILSAATLGIGGLIAGGLIGYPIARQYQCDGRCPVDGFFYSAYAGAALTVPLGVWLVGTRYGQTGSYGAALGGSLLGSVAGVVAVRATDGESTAAWVTVFTAPVLGAVIGFNLTREYRRSSAGPQVVPVASVSGDHGVFGVMGRF